MPQIGHRNGVWPSLIVVHKPVLAPEWLEQAWMYTEEGLAIPASSPVEGVFGTRRNLSDLHGPDPSLEAMSWMLIEEALINPDEILT